MLSIFSRQLILALSILVISPSWGLTNSNEPSAIVIGASLSGLSAAFELQKAGVAVTVLSQNNAVGIPEYSFNGEFINATEIPTEPNAFHTQIHGYLALFGEQQGIEALSDNSLPSSTLPVPTDSLHGDYYLDSKLVAFHDLANIFAQKITPDYQRFWQAFQALNSKAVRILEGQIKQDYLAENPYSLMYENRLNTNASSQTWLAQLELHPAAYLLAKHHIEAVYGKLGTLSVAKLAKMQTTHDHALDRHAQVLRTMGGDRLLASSIAKQLSSPVLLNQTITHVNYSDSGVSIRTQDKTFSAQQLLVAFALPKIGELNFSPALPEKLLSSAQRLNYGAYNKVILEYSQEFLDSLNAQNLALPMGWQQVEASNENAKADQLISYSSGNILESQVYNTQAHLIAIKRAQLETKYPQSAQHFVKARVQAWHREPWPGGEYITYSNDSLNLYWSQFNNAPSNVYFSSSHFNNALNGSQEAALKSGQQAALKMVEASFIKNTGKQLAIGF